MANYKFTLVATYESGRLCMPTDTPDLVEAIQELQTKLAVCYGADKSSLAPRIVKAELIQNLYGV